MWLFTSDHQKLRLVDMFAATRHAHSSGVDLNCADFSDYVREHETYLAERRRTMQILETWGRHQVMNRDFLPSFLFAPADIVVALVYIGLVGFVLDRLVAAVATFVTRGTSAN